MIPESIQTGIFFVESKQSNRHFNQDNYVFGAFPELGFLQQLSNNDISDILRNAISRMSDEIREAMQDKNSGCTLSGCLQVPDIEGNTRIFAYNVGDSFSDLLYVHHDAVKVERLTVDHTLNNKKEHDRRKIVLVRCFDGDVRVKGCGLNITRSLGDHEGEEYGLSHEPEIKAVTVPKNQISNYAILTASDGLNEGIKYHCGPANAEFGRENNYLEEEKTYLAQYIRDYGLTQECIQKLCANIWAYWDSRGSRVDDITIVLGFLLPNLVCNQAVSDGHGVFGHIASEKVREEFHHLFCQEALEFKKQTV